MELYLVKDERNRFHPLSEMDIEKANKIPELEENLFVVKRVRNIKHHRKYFAMIRMCFENQDIFTNEDSFRHWAQVKAGYVRITETPKGKFYDSMSIAFDKMEQPEFSQLYEAVWKVMFDNFAFDSELFESELAAFG